MQKTELLFLIKTCEPAILAAETSKKIDEEEKMSRKQYESYHSIFAKAGENIAAIEAKMDASLESDKSFSQEEKSEVSAMYWNKSCFALIPYRTLTFLAEKTRKEMIDHYHLSIESYLDTLKTSLQALQKSSLWNGKNATLFTLEANRIKTSLEQQNDPVQVILKKHARPHSLDHFVHHILNEDQAMLTVDQYKTMLANENVNISQYHRSDLKQLEGFTPLMLAIRENNPNATKVLLEKNADPFVYLKNENSTLTLGIANGSFEALNEIFVFLKKGNNGAETRLANVKNLSGSFAGATPIMCAAYYGFPAIMDLLCSHGADIQQRTATLGIAEFAIEGFFWRVNLHKETLPLASTVSIFLKVFQKILEQAEKCGQYHWHKDNLRDYLKKQFSKYKGNDYLRKAIRELVNALATLPAPTSVPLSMLLQYQSPSQSSLAAPVSFFPATIRLVSSPQTEENSQAPVFELKLYS